MLKKEKKRQFRPNPFLPACAGARLPVEQKDQKQRFTDERIQARPISSKALRSSASCGKSMKGRQRGGSEERISKHR